MLILVRKEVEKDQVHIFQDKYFGRSKIHHLTIIYHFEHINHDNPMNFVFQNLFKLYLRVHNPHQKYVPYYVTVK